MHLLESPQVTLQLQHYQGEAHVMLHSVPEADVQYSAMKQVKQCFWTDGKPRSHASELSGARAKVQNFPVGNIPLFGLD